MNKLGSLNRWGPNTYIIFTCTMSDLYSHLKACRFTILKTMNKLGSLNRQGPNTSYSRAQCLISILSMYVHYTENYE